MSKKLLCEFIGTFALTFIGVSAICNDAGLTGVALAHGLTIAVMASAFGAITGGHFNPAVSFGLLCAKKMNFGEFVTYSTVQVMGSLGAAALLTNIYPFETWAAVNLGTPALASGISLSKGIIVEAILTFFLVSVVFGTAVDQKAPKVGGLFIGLTVALDILAGGPITGASMNPARTLGPAIAGGFYEGIFAGIIGPILGGALAGFVYTKCLSDEE